MNNETAKRFIGAAQRFKQEIKEVAKELDDEDFRMKMEELGDTVVTSTKSLIAIMEVLSCLFDEDEKESEVQQ